MAHRTNVTQVIKNFEKSEGDSEMVTDPVCGMRLPKKNAKSALFRKDDVIHFCSKECQMKFLNPRRKSSSDLAA